MTRRVVPAHKAALIAGSGVATDVLDPARISVVGSEHDVRALSVWNADPD